MPPHHFSLIFTGMKEKIVICHFFKWVNSEFFLTKLSSIDLQEKNDNSQIFNLKNPKKKLFQTHQNQAPRFHNSEE